MTATEVLSLGLDIGIKDGKIKCIGQGLEAGPETFVVDAEGAYITPGYAIRSFSSGILLLGYARLTLVKGR